MALELGLGMANVIYNVQFFKAQPILPPYCVNTEVVFSHFLYDLPYFRLYTFTDSLKSLMMCKREYVEFLPRLKWKTFAS